MGAPVEPQHGVYGFLRRLQIKGAVDGAFLSNLPLQDAEVLGLLQAAARDSAALGDWEKAELRRHLRTFDPELRRQDTRLFYGDQGRRLAGGVAFSTDAFFADSLPRSQGFVTAALSPRVEGAFGRYLDFVSEASIGGEWSSHPTYLLNYDPQRGLPYNTRKGRTDPSDLDERSTFDAFRTVIGLGNDQYRIEAGNDWNQWGPGIWQHPAFGARPWFWVQDSLPASDSARFDGSTVPGAYRRGYRRPGEGPPMPQVRMTFTWPFLRYTKIFADKQGILSKSDATVVAHRIDVRIGGFDIGAYEMVAYSDRAFEPVYAVPFVPLKIAEHFLGDRDNIALGLDANFAFGSRYRVYSELFLDDLLGPLDLFGDYWGNKFAWVLGGEMLDPLLPASALQFEYARVEPWLYGHHVVDNQLQHFGSLLGSSLPPNSHALRLRWSKALPRSLETAVEYGFLQRQLRDRGSSLFDVHERATDGDDKDFLGEDPETRNALRVDLSARFGRYAEAVASMGLLSVSRWENESAKSLTTPTFAISCKVSY